MIEDLHFRSFTDLVEAVRHWTPELPGDIDAVAGIPRSGLFPANMIALLKHVPLTTVGSLIEGRVLGGGTRLGDKGRRLEDGDTVLVVDDSAQSGSQLARTRAKLEPVEERYRLRYGVVYASRETVGAVDHHFEVVPSPRIFEWNLLNSWIYRRSCVDLDGVICVDPTDEQNDDGEQYLRFMRDAEVLYRPPVDVRCIVTSRLEKYRAPTEAWLNANGVDYRELRMLELPDAETRRARRAHGSFKATVYEDHDALLFIESTRWQSVEIAERTGRPVFCVETMEMIDPHQTRRRTRKAVKSLLTRAKGKLGQLLRR